METGGSNTARLLNMPQAMKQYIDTVKIKLDQLQEQHDILQTVAALIADKLSKGHATFSFGASHAGIITEELTYRAGGLATFNPIFTPALALDVKPVTLTSRFELVEGFGCQLINSSPLGSGDVILVHSVSGRNPIVLDVALTAKKKGATVIAITSMETARQITSKHTSGKLLHEVADFVIDNAGDYGDASVKIEGLAQKVAPTSTVIGAAIANSIVVSVAEKLLEMGVTPPVLASANLDGNDRINSNIFELYKSQIHYL